jgi:hypothetical protein
VVVGLLHEARAAVRLKVLGADRARVATDFFPPQTPPFKRGGKNSCVA